MEKGINQEAMKPGRVFNYGTQTGFLFLGSWIPDSSLNNQPTAIN
jgi:hypothetical protein